MKKLLTLATLIISVFNSSAFSAENHNRFTSLKNDIKNSYIALMNLTTNPISCHLRQVYLNQLNNIISDLNKLDEYNISQNSQKEIDTLALVFMSTFNTQHTLGVNLDEKFGGNLFTDVNDNNLIHDRIVANKQNKGDENISVSINNVDRITKSNYKLLFDTSTHYILTRIKDNTIVSSDDVTSFPKHIFADGISIDLNFGHIVDNDSFTISPLRHAARSIKLLITNPQLLALAWPVTACPCIQQPGSTGTVNITNITDSSNSSFNLPGQLSPIIQVQFLMVGPILKYNLINASSGMLIEGPIPFTMPWNYLFPTPEGYDPGYRAQITGTVQAGDTFKIEFNPDIKDDNRNAISIESLYRKYFSKWIK